RGTPLHAAQLIWLATAGSARSLHLHDKIGSLAPGFEADITVLNLSSTPAIAQRAQNAETMWDKLFATIMMGDDRAIQDVWVAGKRRT
ncbi:MAG: amidohydrolase family protein, partial [Sulfitobacter sp.]|nr:amidohydrolase family protein [Sulfitobacter sp.]